MKNTKLMALLLTAAFAAGCAQTGTGNQGGIIDRTGSAIDRAGAAVDDATITAGVKTSLLADPDVAGTKINVDTEQGRVTLKGEVKTMAIRKKAESLAREVKGVRSVNNQLIITG